MANALPLRPHGGQYPAVRVEELQPEGALGGQPQGERAAGQLGARTLGTGGGGGLRGGARQFEVGALAALARVVGEAHRDDTFGRGVGLHGDQRSVQGVAAALDALDGGVGGETVVVEADIADFRGVRGVHTTAHLPETVGELHGGGPSPIRGCWAGRQGACGERGCGSSRF